MNAVIRWLLFDGPWPWERTPVTRPREVAAAPAVAKHAVEEYLAALAAVPDATVSEIEAEAWTAGATDRDLALATALNFPLPVGVATATAVLNVRAEPATTAASRGKLSLGQTANVWGKRGEWWLVRAGDLWGWAHSAWLKA